MVDEPATADKKEDTDSGPQAANRATQKPSTQDAEPAVIAPNPSENQTTLTTAASNEAAAQQQTSQPEASTATAITDDTTDDRDLFGGSPTPGGGNTMDLDNLFDDFADGDSNLVSTSAQDTKTADANINNNDAEYDFSSLLPGLESYANNAAAASDEFNFDLPAGDDLGVAGAGGGAENAQALTQQQSGSNAFANDPTFDDFFSWDGSGGGGGDVAGDTNLDDLFLD